MLTREEALQLIKQHVQNENLFKHMLAVGAIMKKCAEYLGENQNKWALVGLLHDIDFDKIKHPKSHGIVACEILKDKVDEEVLTAIKSHNFENTGTMPQSKMDYCLIAADAISGLIIACALVIPSKKLNDVKVKLVTKKYKEKDFARNCSREKIYFCEKIGIDRIKFAELALTALQEIASDLGL